MDYHILILRPDGNAEIKVKESNEIPKSILVEVPIEQQSAQQLNKTTSKPIPVFQTEHIDGKRYLYASLRGRITSTHEINEAIKRLGLPPIQE